MGAASCGSDMQKADYTHLIVDSAAILIRVD
jgi:hypothetical protein